LLFVVQGIVIDDVEIVLDPDVIVANSAIVVVETVATVEEPFVFKA